MSPEVIIAVISAVSAVVGAVLTYRAMSRAQTIDAKKVDQAAYDQTVGFYEKQLDRITVQFDRVNAQLDKVTAQLANEQDVSNVLRNQVRALEGQVAGMSLIINELKGQLSLLRPKDAD